METRGDRLIKLLKALVSAYSEVKALEGEVKGLIKDNIVKPLETEALRHLIYNFEERRNPSVEDMEKAIRELLGIGGEGDLYENLRKKLANSLNSS